MAAAPDGGRREAGDPVRVVGRVRLEVAETQLLPVAERVLDRRIGVELPPDVESFRVHASDRGALFTIASLTLDDRPELHDVVDRRLPIHGGLPPGLLAPQLALIGLCVDA